VLLSGVEIPVAETPGGHATGKGRLDGGDVGQLEDPNVVRGHPVQLGDSSLRDHAATHHVVKVLG
jgi:hypothetical protein